MSNEAERFEVEGLTVRIMYEEGDASFADPRDMDQLGAMVCWHPDYILGDEQVKAAGGAYATDARTHGQVFETERGRTDFRSMEVIERYLRVARGAVVILPLYLLDHSGISMSAGAPSLGDTPMGGRDHHGNARMWDTTHVGYIYTTRERIRELCGECPGECCEGRNCTRCNDSRIYKPEDYEGTPLQWIAKQLRDEVGEYDLFLRGEVYYYVIQDEDGETLDSCGGFLGSEHVEEAARESATFAAAAKRANAEPDMETAVYAASR